MMLLPYSKMFCQSVAKSGTSVMLLPYSDNVLSVCCPMRDQCDATPIFR